MVSHFGSKWTFGLSMDDRMCAAAWTDSNRIFHRSDKTNDLEPDRCDTAFWLRFGGVHNTAHDLGVIDRSANDRATKASAVFV